MTINLAGRKIEVKKSVLVLAIISAVVITGGIGFAISGSGRDIIIEGKNIQNAAGATTKSASSELKRDGRDSTKAIKDGVAEEPSQKAETELEQADKQADSIKIYIVGCVKKPGVITLKKGQLIDDAVRSAGGLTQDADPDSINMVYELKENVMLHIQSKKEISKDNEASEAGTGVKVVKDSGSAKISGKDLGNSSTSGSVKDGKVNINTASATELDTLPGIGEATAKEIISFREANGPFKKTSDIMKIPRLKDSRYNAIKDLITVE